MSDLFPVLYVMGLVSYFGSAKKILLVKDFFSSDVFHNDLCWNKKDPTSGFGLRFLGRKLLVAYRVSVVFTLFSHPASSSMYVNQGA